MKPIVCLITGPSGAGKSTIAEQLAKHFHKAAVIDGDILWNLVKRGQINIYPYSKESIRQLRIVQENACSLASNFADNGFSVFISYVAVHKDELDIYFRRLRKYNFFAFLLMPRKGIVKARDMKRVRGKLGKRALQLHNEFSRRLDEKRWRVIDTSNHSVQQTTLEILKAIKKGNIRRP